ncbi:MAG: ABC transporter ATP-binding protein [Burkholderiaceae bacterium]
MASIVLHDLHKSFGGQAVLRGIDLEVADGELVVLLGPSGCGKSTLLRLIAGLDLPDRGRIFIDGRDLTAMPPARRGVSMVFQSYALYPHMNVRRNIAFGLKLAHEPAGAIEQRVREVASMLRIDELLDRLPRELSGGQRQRVAIARAIARRPRVCLFDEPLSNLDAALRAHTRLELANMHETLGTTMVYVTHDQTEAMTLADRIVVLDRGAVCQIGSPTQIYGAPADLFVAGFIGSPPMNLLPAHSDGATAVLPGGQPLALPLAAATALRGPVTVGIRPDELRLLPREAATEPSHAGVALDGTIVRVEELGESRLVHVRLAGETVLVARDRGAARPERGAAVRLYSDPGHWHLFDAQGRRVEPASRSPDILRA